MSGPGEHYVPHDRLAFTEKQAGLVSGLSNSFRNFSRQQYILDPSSAHSTFNLIKRYSLDAQTIGHYKLDPFIEEAAFGNRFHTFCGDLGRYEVQMARLVPLNRFKTPFVQFEGLFKRPSIVWSSDDGSYKPNFLEQMKFDLMSPNAIAKRHAELAMFYASLALSESGFKNDNTGIYYAVISDFLLHRSRDHYFAFEDIWWEHEYKKYSEKMNSPSALDEVTNSRDTKRATMEGMYRHAIAYWTKLKEGAPVPYFQDLAANAIEDMTQVLETSGNKDAPSLDQLKSALLLPTK